MASLANIVVQDTFVHFCLYISKKHSIATMITMALIFWGSQHLLLPADLSAIAVPQLRTFRTTQMIPKVTGSMLQPNYVSTMTLCWGGRVMHATLTTIAIQW